MGDLAREFESLLGSSSTEKPIQRFFEAHPDVFVNTFAGVRRGHLVAQFNMGGKFIPDFVMANGFSGGWNILMVELESPDAVLFNKDGTPSRKLREANRQIDEWKLYIEQNRSLFLRELSYAIREKDLTCNPPGLGHEPLDHCEMKMTDPGSMIIFEYVIVIGRSSKLCYEDLIRKTHTNRESYETVTYDRFLETAKRITESK